MKQLAYVQPGYYFATICVEQRRQVLGKVVTTSCLLTPLGKLIESHLQTISEHHPCWTAYVSVVMPNHIHLLLWKQASADYQQADNSSFSPAVGSLKSAMTKAARDCGLWNGGPLWQRGFYDHVVRSEQALYQIRSYIEHNPLQWHLDCLNPLRQGTDPFQEWIEAQDLLRQTWPGNSGEARLAPTVEAALPFEGMSNDQ